MSFQLHDSVDAEALKRAYAASGRVIINPFLPDEQAEALRTHLLGRDDWRPRLRDLDGRLFELSPDEAAEWGPHRIDAVRNLIAPRQGQTGFGYAHTRLRIVDTEGGLQESSSLLGEFGQFMVSEPVLELFRHITGEDQLNFADSFAARYDPGDYTTMHDDGVDERKTAYVFGLTKSWRADWGGLLLFHDEDGAIECGLIPGFNSFNLFAVPRRHSVSVVAPFATEPRLTITGWFHRLGKDARSAKEAEKQEQEQTSR